MSSQQIIVWGIAVVALILIFSNRVRSDLAGLLLMAALPLSGVLSVPEALAGWSSPVIATLIGLFIITRALEDAGVISGLAGQLRRLGGASETRLILVLASAAALLSLAMNTVAVGAMLLPAAMHVARSSEIPPSRLLIPLSFGTLLGGMATTFTTANIVMSGLLAERGLEPLRMLDFMTTGGIVALAGLIYLGMAGPRLLPRRDSLTAAMLPAASLDQAYHLPERLWSLRVTAGSRLEGVTLAESCISEQLGLTVLAIERGRARILGPGPKAQIQAGDSLLVLGHPDRVEILQEWGTSLLSAPEASGKLRRAAGLDLAEVFIPPRSTVAGSTLTELHFRERSGLSVVALWRSGRSFRTDVGKMPLEIGDGMLVLGDPADLKRLSRSQDYLVMDKEFAATTYHPRKAALALSVALGVLGLAFTGLLPLPALMLAGAAILMLTGAISLEGAYLAIEWRVIFLVAGFLPLSTAMLQSGITDQISRATLQLLGQSGPLVLAGGLYLLATLLTQMIGGQVAALVVGPVAIQAALISGVDARPLALALALGCSSAFLTPLAHPVNALMMGPGGYRPADLPRIGVGMLAVTLAALLAGLAIFWF